MSRLSVRSGGLLLVILIPLLADGCSSSKGDGKKVHPVSGKVLYRDQAPTGALVVFIPADEPPEPIDPRPHGTVQADGAFRLTTFEPDDGAPAGDYTVIITWPSESRDEPEDKFLGRFADRKRSTIKFAIRAGKNELDPIVLK